MLYYSFIEYFKIYSLYFVSYKLFGGNFLFFYFLFFKDLMSCIYESNGILGKKKS